MSGTDSANRGRLVIVSGPSGVGKSTICHRLCDALPAEFSVSVTTRRPRPGEADNRDYRYVDAAAFAGLRDQGELLEWAEVYGHLYGTPLSAVESALADGRIIILEIDIHGCRQVREKMPDAMSFFLLPPTPDEQKRRIVERKTDAAEVIQQRLSRADGEIRFAMDAGCYDEFVINDDLDATVETIARRIRRGM